MGERSARVRAADGSIHELTEISPASLAQRAADPAELLWLDLADPGAAELDLLREGLSLHPLAIEDIEKRRQRPKLDTYPSQYVIVAYEILDRGADHRHELGEVHLIVSRGALVSIHWGPSPTLADVTRLFRARTPGVAEDSGALLYSILDEIADGYPRLLDRISEQIDSIENRVVAGERERDALRDVLQVKRGLLELRRVIAPLRDVANTLLRRELDVVSAAALPYYQDLYDHLVRVLDAIDLYRDILAAALDANLAMASNNLNLVVKRLTALTVILMLPTLIAGIYGMNFAVMPELHWPWGYAFALGLMLAVILGALAFFRGRDWL